MSSVDGIIFDAKSGSVIGLMVNQSSDKSRISLNDMILSIHSKNIVLKHTGTE